MKILRYTSIPMLVIASFFLLAPASATALPENDQASAVFHVA